MGITKKPSIGLIGLGLIGCRVAANLRRDGFPLFVWNRTPRSEPNFLPSPADVAEAADIIQIFVRDGIALLEVLQNLSPALTARHIILNHATVHPQQTLEAAALVEKRGARFLDAPFTGSRDAAAEGKLVYFIGGSSETLKEIRAVLEASAQEILIMGPLGAATYVKIATNLIMGTQVEVLAEALELLKLGNVPLYRLGEALEYSAANAGVIKMKLPLMMQGDFDPRFSIKNMLKDLHLGLDLAEAHGSVLPTTAATATAYTKAVEEGLGEADIAALASSYDYPGKEASLFSLQGESSSLSSKKSADMLASKKSLFSFFKKEQ